jgi:CRP-like cAMP-binding protein
MQDRFPTEFARFFEKVSVHQRLSDGEALFHQDDPGDAAYFLRSGTLEVSVMSEDGRRLPLARIEEGRIVGEIALFTDVPRTATVTAVGPCVLDRVGRNQLLEEIARNPALAGDLLDMAGRRLAAANERLEDHIFHPLPNRLARHLLGLHQRAAKGDPIFVSQTDLADHLGVTREAVSKCLGTWKRSGWIRTGRERLWIDRPEDLKREILADNGFDG